jgi:hypothetical protein
MMSIQPSVDCRRKDAYMPAARLEYWFFWRELDGCHLDDDLVTGFLKIVCETLLQCWCIVNCIELRFWDPRFAQCFPLALVLVVISRVVLISTAPCG